MRRTSHTRLVLESTRTFSNCPADGFHQNFLIDDQSIIKNFYGVELGVRCLFANDARDRRAVPGGVSIVLRGANAIGRNRKADAFVHMLQEAMRPINPAVDHRNFDPLASEIAEIAFVTHTPR